MIQNLNELLQAHGAANEGTNHVSDYAIYKLPSGPTIRHSLDAYFSTIHTPVSPPQPARKWYINISLIDNPRPAIRKSLKHWFFELEFSPIKSESVQDDEIDRFIELLTSVVAASSVYDVQVNPPLWYDCVWQDYAFDGDSDRWILHMGFSD